MKRKGGRKPRTSQTAIIFYFMGGGFALMGGAFAVLGIIERAYLPTIIGLLFFFLGVGFLAVPIVKGVRRRRVFSDGVERRGVIAAHDRDTSLIINGAPELVLVLRSDTADGYAEEFTVHTGSGSERDYPLGAEVRFFELDGRAEIAEVFPLRIKTGTGRPTQAAQGALSYDEQSDLAFGDKMTSIFCPHCGTVLKAPQGSLARCPGCGRTVRL